MISAHLVSFRLSSSNSEFWAMKYDWMGISSPRANNPSNKPLPLNWNRLKAKAARAAKSRITSTAAVVTMTLLRA